MLDEFDIKIYGDTAVVLFTQKLTGPSKGQPLTLTFRYMDVFVMRDSRWQCVRSTEHPRDDVLGDAGIHAPDKPILTVKEAVIHLSIVTVGILIALSLEGALEWQHHRALVREARAKIATEIATTGRSCRNNARSNRSHGLAVEKRRGHTDRRDGASWNPAAAERLFSPAGPPNVLWGYTVAELTRASYATAESTGALGYMDYDEVKKYAEIHNFQDTYTRQQTRVFDHATTAAALGTGLLKKPSQADIDSVKGELRQAMGGMTYERAFADILLKTYDRALAEAK